MRTVGVEEELLLVDVHEAPAGFGGLAFVAFNVTMLIGRLAGGPATTRWGRAALARGGGLLAGTGILLITLAPSLEVALVAALLNAVFRFCLGCELYLILRRINPA